MNAEKITFSEASMIRLRDIMMSAMFEQAEKIRKERPATAADISNIVVNYLAQTGHDENSQELLKESCLLMFKGMEF